MNSAKRRASSALLIIGAMTAAAPASARRLAQAKSPTGIRAIVGFPASATARIDLARADEVDPAVLHVEGHRVEGFARQRVGYRPRR